MSDGGYEGAWRVFRRGDRTRHARYYFWPLPMRRLAKAWDLYLEPEADHLRGMGIWIWMRHKRVLRVEARDS